RSLYSRSRIGVSQSANVARARTAQVPQRPVFDHLERRGDARPFRSSLERAVRSPTDTRPCRLPVLVRVHSGRSRSPEGSALTVLTGVSLTTHNSQLTTASRQRRAQHMAGRRVSHVALTIFG